MRERVVFSKPLSRFKNKKKHTHNRIQNNWKDDVMFKTIEVVEKEDKPQPFDSKTKIIQPFQKTFIVHHVQHTKS